MEDELITILESFKYPVIRQGSLGPDDDYPDTFITFFEDSDREVQAYDNETFTARLIYHLAAYSTSPATTYELTGYIREALKAAGWQMVDRGHDVASDEITHTGRGLTVSYTTQNTEIK